MENKDVVSIAGFFGAVALIGIIAAAGSQGGAQVAGWPVFAICGLLALGVQWLVFIPSYINQTEHFFDLTGSLTYITMMMVGLLLAGADARGMLIAALVVIWAARLGSFLFRRVRDDGSDKRFNSIKPDFLRFGMTWTLQGAWVFVTAAAGLTAITSSTSIPLGITALIGTIMWVVGFAIEVAADRQKRAFKADSERETDFITSGLWAWSRHPNYFGEIMLWCGIALIALPVLSGWQYLTLISPIFVVVLLTRISGIPMLERRADRAWGSDPLYQQYKQSTPILIPRPPG